MAYGNERFGIIDYCVLLATLTISLGIGIAASYKGNKSPEEFLMGNRNIGTIPVAMSLLCSFVSAVNYIGFTTEVYAYGMQISMLAVGSVIGILIATFVTLPVLFPLRLTSIHEYVELRFKSSNLRLLLMFLILFNAIVYMGVCLYATSLAIAAVTPLSFVIYIFLLGIICTIYSTLGGIRAVVWTDVFQCVVMLFGLILVVVIGIFQVGGVSELYAIASEGNRTQMFNMNPSIYERHSFYNTVTLGTCLFAALYGVSQVNVQRMCAVSTVEKSRKVLAINAVGMVIIHLLICLGGLVIYAVYAGCDPFLSGKLERMEEVLSYFVMDRLSFIPGLPGVFVAVLMSSTLSTFSSVVNAQVAVIWEDLLTRFKIFSFCPPQEAAIIIKGLTFIVGSAFIGMALLASRVGSLIQLINAVGGIIFGTIYGIFLLGICFPRSTATGAWAGLIISCSLLSWIYIGAIFNSPLPELLPMSVDLCNKTSLAHSPLGHRDHPVTPVNLEFVYTESRQPEKIPTDRCFTDRSRRSALSTTGRGIKDHRIYQ